MKILRFFGFVLGLLVIIFGIYLYKGPIPVDVVDARYTSPSSQFLVMGNGARIHYRDEGNRQGNTIVLLHGSSASLHTWQPWVEILSPQYRVITLDMPGHGLTGSVPDDDYSTEASIETLQAVLSHLQVAEFILGGNSMGGYLSWRYALNHPERVTALILVDAAGPSEWWTATEDNDDGPLIFKLLTWPWFRAIATRLDSYYLVKWGVEDAYNNSPVVTDELILRYYELILRKGTRQATMIRFAEDPRDSNETFDLSLIKQPTLILWGEEDSFISADIARKFEEAIPNTKLVTFAGVGHIPMEEIPEKSANTVLDFLQSQEYQVPAESARKTEER